MVDVWLARQRVIAKVFKKEAQQRGISQTEVARKINQYWTRSTTPAIISNLLNWNKRGSDSYWYDIGRALGMSTLEVDAILREADIEAVKNLYGDNTHISRYTTEEHIDAIAKIESLDNSTTFFIKKFIKFIILEAKNKDY